MTKITYNFVTAAQAFLGSRLANEKATPSRQQRRATQRREDKLLLSTMRRNTVKNPRTKKSVDEPATL